jgi:hypothetical protein
MDRDCQILLKFSTTMGTVEKGRLTESMICQTTFGRGIGRSGKTARQRD